MRNRCIVLLIGAVTLMLLVAVWRVQAAPRLPQSKTLPNEALNLGGLTEVAIEVSGKSSELRDDGVDADPNYYEPTTLDLSYELLSDFGLLRVWKELGNKYDAGEL